MASIILTIGVIVARFSALVALRNNIVCNSFAQAIIKNKILSNELAFQTFCFNLFGVIDDSTFQLENIFETLVFEISTCFLTTNSTCTIHHQVFVFFVVLKLLVDYWQTFPESFNIGS